MGGRSISASAPAASCGRRWRGDIRSKASVITSGLQSKSREEAEMWNLRSLLVALPMAVLGLGTLVAQVPKRPFLYKDARSELATLRARGDTVVVVLIAAATGANDQVVAAVERLGGAVQYRDDD